MLYYLSLAPTHCYTIIVPLAHAVTSVNTLPRQMSDASLAAVRAVVCDVRARYEARAAAPQRQRLVWRLSERTLKVGCCYLLYT